MPIDDHRVVIAVINSYWNILLPRVVHSHRKPLGAVLVEGTAQQHRTDVNIKERIGQQRFFAESGTFLLKTVHRHRINLYDAVVAVSRFPVL